MTPLSSSTLFHFTRSIERLVGILTHEFVPHYSLESFAEVLGDKASENLFVGLPMVCFCDIPLSQTAFHMEMYGDYALGLTKQWGMRAGVAPVLYTYPNAATTDAVVRLHLEIEELRGTAHDGAAFSAQTERFLCFVKPYEGYLAGPYRAHVRFYDEREWRYVPPPPWEAIPGAAWADEATRDLLNAHLRTCYRLSFEPGDIRYIVVQSEEEIPRIINEVRRIKSPKYSADDIDLLCSRIVSATQIRDDF